MKITADQQQAFGSTGLRVPPIVFGSGALANVRRVIPDQTKLAICGEWFRHVAPPVFIEASQQDDGGWALEALARAFQRFDVAPEEVVICSKLGRKEGRLSYSAVLATWDETCRRLGGKHRPQLVSLDAPEEYLAAAGSPAERGRRFQGFLDAYRALDDLKTARQVAGIGVAAKDWHVVQEIDSAARLDWVTLVGSYTVMRHPAALSEFVASLAARQIPVVCAGIFHCGFLVGGNRFDGRTVSADDPADHSLFAWRKAFAALCNGHGVTPAHACIQFALAVPGVAAVAVNTSHPDRVAENVESAVIEVPAALWSSMREEGLLAQDVPR